MVLAAASGASMLLDTRVVHVLVGVVDLGVLVLAAAAGVVAWRVAGRSGAVAVYVLAVGVFATLALISLRL